MTGATVIAKKGEDFYLVKVRSDGYDVLDILPELLVSGVDPEQLLLAYFDKRKRMWSKSDMDLWESSSLAEEVERRVLKFSLPEKDHPRALSDLYNLATRTADGITQGEREWVGYRCGYEDYQVMIDCDEEKVWGLIHRDSGNVPEVKWHTVAKLLASA